MMKQRKWLTTSDGQSYRKPQAEPQWAQPETITRHQSTELSFTQSFSKRFICLFDLILYVPSTIFQLNRDWSSWVKQVLSWDKCLAQGLQRSDAGIQTI